MRHPPVTGQSTGWRAAAAVLLLGCVAVSTLDAQTGRIEGTVRSAETGAPIPQAEVYIRALNRSAVTDAKGVFLFADVPVAVYELLVRAVGFQSKVYLDQAVYESPVVTLDLRLDRAVGITGTSGGEPQPMITLPTGWGLGIAAAYDGLGRTDGAIGSSGAIEAFGRYGFSTTFVLRGGILLSRRSIEIVDYPYQLFGAYLEPRYVAQSLSPVWAPFVAGQLGLARESVGRSSMSLSAIGTWLGGGGGAMFRVGPQLATEIGVLVGTATFGDYTFRGDRAWYYCLNELETGSTLPTSVQDCAGARGIGAELCYPPFYPENRISGDCRPPDVPYADTGRSGMWFRVWFGMHFSLTGGGGRR